MRCVALGVSIIRVGSRSTGPKPSNRRVPSPTLGAPTTSICSRSPRRAGQVVERALAGAQEDRGRDGTGALLDALDRELSAGPR